MFRRTSEELAKETRKIWIRTDLFLSQNTATARKDSDQVGTSTSKNWHWKKETQPHVRRLSRNTQALDSKSQLGYEADDDTNNTSDDENKEGSPKRRKIYYEEKIGGPIATSPSYTKRNNNSEEDGWSPRYTPPSPSPSYSSDDCPTWIKNLEVSTLVHNPFKSDGDTTDDENLNNNDRTDAELDAYYLSLFSE